MKTLIDVNEDTLKRAMILSGAITKKEAIMLALEELIRAKLRQRLKQMAGSGSLDMKLSDLKMLRQKKAKIHNGLLAKNK